MKKITVPVEIEVPDGYELDFIDFSEARWWGNNPLNQSCVAKFKKIKPAKKVIDLSCIVGSGIDCEFSDDGNTWVIDQLNYETDDCYKDNDNISWVFCRIRQSPHVHFWKGGDKCPLPEGLTVSLRVLAATGVINKYTLEDYNDFEWRKIVGFEILGPAEGWRYEWEEE